MSEARVTVLHNYFSTCTLGVVLSIKMDNEIDGLPVLSIDAVPQNLHVNINENTCDLKSIIENLLSGFCVDDYKSAFFLLMDFVELSKFLPLTKQDESFLKCAFIQLYCAHFTDDRILVELLGTLKMYKKLKLLDTCHHIYESQEKKFSQIDGIWKILYSLCEELNDEDVENLKQFIPSNCRGQILSAEDWFCCALQNKIFSRTNLSDLESIFNNYPKCLNIIKSYKDFGTYDIRTPTALSDCGIALIINFKKFDENSGLEKRENSEKDVNSLVELWKSFGFKTDVYKDLKYSEAIKILNNYATLDHSKYDAFVCCILSHGQSNTVYSSDGKLIPIPDLIAPIAMKCSSLNKKPKLFFIQACQGPNIHQGVGKPIYKVKTADTPATGSYNSSVPPILCDVLIVNSSIDGYVSFRGATGSWFIQSLCKLVKQYGASSSFEELMTKVNEEVSKNSANILAPLGPINALQIVHRSSTLGKKLILKKRIC